MRFHPSMNMKALLGLLLICSLPLGCSPSVTPEKSQAIQRYLKTSIAESLEKDYRGHGMPVAASVTGLTIDRLTKKESQQDFIYLARGRVSYIIRGPKTWKDQEGNLIQLGPAQEITHWFTCGILEDRYLGTFREDDRNRLQFYADNPAEQ